MCDGLFSTEFPSAPFSPGLNGAPVLQLAAKLAEQEHEKSPKIGNHTTIIS